MRLTDIAFRCVPKHHLSLFVLVDPADHPWKWRVGLGQRQEHLEGKELLDGCGLGGVVSKRFVVPVAVFLLLGKNQVGPFQHIREACLFARDLVGRRKGPHVDTGG